MPPSEIRKEAREALIGKWGKGILILLAFFAFSFAIGLIEGIVGEGSVLYTIIDIAYFIISIPLSFGLIISFIKLKRGEDVKAFGFLTDGLPKLGKAWGITLHTLLRMLLPVVCLILIVILLVGLAIFNANSTGSISIVLTILSIALYIATLIYTVSRSLLYTLSYYISYDNPELTSRECVLKSEELMKGNRGNYFLLQLSFIGWAILTVFSLGIGMLWLAPYISVAEVCFYDRIINSNVEKSEKIEE